METSQRSIETGLYSRLKCAKGTDDAKVYTELNKVKPRDGREQVVIFEDVVDVTNLKVRKFIHP